MNLFPLLLVAVAAITLLEPAATASKPQGANVRTYGAVGDGKADDAAAIQAALDKENHVFLPAGVYRLGKRLSINRSGVAFVGTGATTVLKPDASLTTGTILVEGSTTLTDIEIGKFKLDGSADPAKVQGLGVNNCKRVRVHGITPVSISGMVGFLGVENFTVYDIAGSDLIEFISMIHCKEGVLANIRVSGHDEGFDFFNCEDVEITGAVLTAREPSVIKHAEWAVAVDLSSSRRITISQCTFSGHYYGVKMKHDFEVGVGAPPVEDILISNCQIREYKTAGILLAVDKGRNCRIQSCHIRSTRKDASGIYGFLPKSSKLADLVVSDCAIESPHTGIRFNNYDGAEVRNCKIRGGVGHAINVYECDGLKISGSDLRSENETAVQLTSIQRPVVEDCELRGAAGMWVANCLTPIIRRNIVPGAKGRGISVQWSGAETATLMKGTAGFIIDDNVVRDWGTASPGNAAIAVSFSEMPKAKLAQGSVSRNRLLLESQNQHVRYGISFLLGDVAPLESVVVESNLIEGAYTGLLGAEALGPGSVERGNVIHRRTP